MKFHIRTVRKHTLPNGMNSRTSGQRLSIECMSHVQQNLLFSSICLQLTGCYDGALQVYVAGIWQVLLCVI